MKTYSIDKAGFANGAQQIVSPNFDDRPNIGGDYELEPDKHTGINLIVIHNISLPPGQYGGNGIIELFTNSLIPSEHPYYAEIYTRQVSAHFLIRRDGSLIQFVSCLKRAWHAGASNWQGRERCNDFSVGIELEGSDFDAYDPAQYLTLKKIIPRLSNVYPIQAIVGHSDIAPGRKTDPGPYFDWQKLSNKSN